jgi:2-polyprenyl-6-hydroxyphenyl methylase/3-demethylubiquinone-9 3-methyltransferase
MLNTSSRPEFVEYYASLHTSERKIGRFRNTRDCLLSIHAKGGRDAPLNILDIGCNAGAFSRVWAELGHRVTGLDINAPLLEVARKESAQAGFDIRFHVGSATELPFGNGEFDICCLPELLEHVADWESCLNEAARVVKPGGIVHLSTTNWLCPKQNEYSLPAYSWYPGFLKRHFEKLAVTTHPEYANHATFPAVHWFSYYGLRRFFRQRGFECMDRFDVAARTKSDKKILAVLWLIRHVPGLRLIAHMFSVRTTLVGRKKAAGTR